LGQNTEHFTLNKSWFHAIWGSGPNVVIDEWKSKYLPDVNLYSKKPCIIHRIVPLKGFSGMWVQIIYYDRFWEFFFQDVGCDGTDISGDIDLEVRVH